MALDNIQVFLRASMKTTRFTGNLCVDTIHDFEDNISLEVASINLNFESQRIITIIYSVNTNFYLSEYSF